jgi:hypothetical protein
MEETQQMKSRKLSLTAMAATLAVSGVILLSSVPAQAEVTYDSLLVENGGDVPSTHWAANAIQGLVDKYGVMSGYPDKTFRGNRQVSRYELAASLYGVMQAVDKMMAEMQPPDMSKYATKADLQKLAELQKMFKEELDMLKKKHMALSDKVDMMDRVQVHGGVQVRYRDRVSVTDGTQSTSPLFNAANKTDGKSVTNNNGDFTRDANGLPQTFNNPDASNVTVDDSNPFRVRASLKVKAKLTDGIMAKTKFDMYEQAVGNGGHDANEGPGQFVLRDASLNVGQKDEDGMGATWKIGFTNLSDVVNPGTSLMNHFNNSQWNGHGYGLVGWGGSEKATVNSAKADFKNSTSRYWMGGINSSNVDPDSQMHNMVSSPTTSLDFDWGWGKFMVGVNYGSTMTNRDAAAKGNLSGLYAGADSLPGSGFGQSVAGSNAAFTASSLFSGANLPSLDRQGKVTSGLLALPSEYGDGYGVAGLEFNLLKESFPIRLGLHGMSYLNDNLTDFTNPTRKELSGVLDLGWDKGFGLTVQVNKSFSGYDKHSLGLFFNDLGGSGFDIQLGANLATRGLFAISNTATGSAGLVLGIPFVNMGEGKDMVKLLLSARQSIGDSLGNAQDAAGAAVAGYQMFKDSGLTASLMYNNIGSSPLNIRAEYSMLGAEELWSFKPVAHDVSVITSYWF